MMNDEQKQDSLQAPASSPPTEQAKSASAQPKKGQAARSASSGGSKKGSSDRVHTSTAESAGRGGASRKKASPSGGSAPKKPKKEKVELDEIPRSSRPAHRVIPFLLIALAVFLATCLFLNLFCNLGNRCAANPSDHWMGSAGYWICYCLFGMFGPAAFAIPLLILNMALFWKAYIDNRLVLEKAIASLVCLVFLSTLIHACCLAVLPVESRHIVARDLIQHGAKMTGGGLVGGGIGYLLVRALNAVGGILVSVFLTLLSVFFFLGMTPQHLMERIKTARNLKNASKDPLGADDEEPIIEQIRQKHKKAATGQTTTDLTESPVTPPVGAVQYRGETKGKRAQTTTEDDGLAPMPMPILDASDEDAEENPLFVPDDVPQKEDEPRIVAMSTAEEAPKKSETPPPTPTTPAPAPTPMPAPKPAPEPQQPPRPAPTSQTMDSVFPRTPVESGKRQRVQRSDRQFELRDIFIDLDDHKPSTPPPARKHAPLPPEVPMPDSSQRTRTSPAPQRPTDGRAAPTTPTARPSATGASTQKPTPGVTRPAGSGVVPRPAVPSTKQPAEPRTTAAPARPASGGARPRPAAPSDGSKADASRPAPIIRQAQSTEKVEYGLTPEEFERREAAVTIYRASSSKKTPTGGKAAPAKPTTPPKKPETAPKPKKYVFPPISYLHPGEPLTEQNKAEIVENMKKLQETLGNFNVRVREITYSIGPTVTRYEIFPDVGVRVRSITNLADDIALAFAVQGVRMEAIAGKSAIGVEVPNTTRSNIFLRDLLESPTFKNSTSRLTAGLGADVTNTPLLFDVAKMPHLLVAGTTGSGKSICINCIIMSILYKARPDEVKLLLIDPKKVEFAPYKGLPHLLAPIVLTPKDAAGALQAAVEEMENRFSRIQDVGVHDIAGYNRAADKDPDLPHMPHVVIIIDELADLMMTARDEVEDSICRLAQKARAAGMHIIVGTQRPSVDVVTGLIKSNIPSRIACTVRSQVDSRTILDFAGAEKLLGKGDMLFAPIGAMKPTRVQGAFVSEDEVEKICEFIRVTNGTAVYDENFINKMKEYSEQFGKKGSKAESDSSLPTGEGDNKYVDAIRIGIEENRVSTSLLQRKLGIGYGRAAKIIDRMEEEGLVSKPDGAKPRSILITAEQFIERYVEGDAGKGGEDI